MSLSLSLSLSLLTKLTRNTRCIITSTRMSTSTSVGGDNIVHMDDNGDIEIPKYNIHRDETLERKKSRLVYQSRKRGMLENDLLLSTFAEKYLQAMSAEETEEYDRLINIPSNDWDIFYWAAGHKPTPPEYDNRIMNMFKKHVQNQERQLRIRQPPLP